MIDYSRKSDTELIKLHHSGDRWAFEEIAGRYKDTVKFHARFFFLTGGDSDDLLQEGMIGLFEAADTFRDDRNASFATFADRCIRSRMIKAVKTDNKKSNRPLNTSVSIDGDKEQTDDGNRGSVSGSLESDGGIGNPEAIVINKELYRLKVEKINEELSDFEKKVFYLYLSGRSLNEIAEETAGTYKSADNALSRIKAKVRNISSDILSE